MTKNEQIEEIEQFIYDYVDSKQTERVYLLGSRVDELAKPFVHNKGIAEALYNAGYRKVGSDAKGNLLKIQNLCIEFDEMGYEPTTLCENPEQTAKKWKSDLMFEIGLFLDESMGIKARYNELKAENERLTERLKQVLLSIDTVKEMNAMCNIDEQRKQAVKEFAEKLKMKAFNKDMFNDWAGATYVVLVREIDKLLKEYER